jgi:quinone-modifying oxidoreductase subunit QmoB
VSEQEKKVAVFICEGCDIGKSLDVDALKDVELEDADADSFHTHPFLCGD